MKLITILQIKDQLTNCIEIYLDQHSNIYLSSSKGSIYLVNELTKEVSKIIDLKCSILKMIYFKRKSRFLIISDEFILYQYNILSNLPNDNLKHPNIKELSSVKLEVFSKSFNHIEKLTGKKKSKKETKSTSSLKQDDIFCIEN